MSERTEHDETYWREFGHRLMVLALDKAPDRNISDGYDRARRVWQEEERHAWAGSQDAVTRRVAELASVLERRGHKVTYGFNRDQADSYAQGLFDAAAIITHRDPESAA